jgi:hypothetical protein
MKWTPQKTIVCASVADVIGDVLHLRALVVVREDDGVLLRREAAHLVV